MKLKNIIRLYKHRDEAKKLLEALLIRLGNPIEFGSLTGDEVNGLIEWIEKISRQADRPLHIVEIGTLFGSTSRQLACIPNTRLTTVDNFSWNPFGLDPVTHENFTRHLLRGTGIDVVKADSVDYLAQTKDIGFVFLDGDHSYAAVRDELLALTSNNIAHIAGHDWGDERFGVTKAVKEILGTPDKVIGRCWYKHYVA